MGSAQDAYLRRAAAPRERLVRARRPVSIVAACAAGAVVAGAALGSGTWSWFLGRAAETARGRVERTGMTAASPGQVFLYELLLAVLACAAWVAVVLGVWRGARPMRHAGLALAALSAVVAGASLPGTHPVESTVHTVGLLASLVVLGLLAVPNGAWFDWRRHGPTAPRH